MVLVMVLGVIRIIRKIIRKEDSLRIYLVVKRMKMLKVIKKREEVYLVDYLVETKRMKMLEIMIRM